MGKLLREQIENNKIKQLGGDLDLFRFCNQGFLS